MEDIMLRVLGLLAVFTLAVLAPAQAQTDYPNKPVVIVVPFPAGGSSDVVSRVLADELSKIWKQQVVVDNKPGGATVIGNTAVARSRPDGHTLLMASSGFVILPAVRENMPYDTVKDFIPISMFIDTPLAIVASPNFEANTLAELIELAKRRTDRPITYCTPGAASTSRMVGELMQRKAGISLKHIAYLGESLAFPDLMAGRVDVQIGTWSVQRPLVESGKLKLLAVLYRNRLPEAPNAPTLTEVIPGVTAAEGAFNSVAAPAGTPPEVVAKIAADMKTAVESPTFKERILALGAYPRYTAPEETAAMLRRDMAMWSEIAKAANIKVD
jgi:tripartite-type tricarboxylate transporter receptor subunit TctC